MEQEQEKKKRIWVKIVGWVLVAGVAFVAVVAIGIYRFSWQGGVVNAMVSVAPFPVAIVDYHFVTFADFNKRFEAYRKAVEFNQEFDFTDPANNEVVVAQKQALLDRMVELELIEQIAKDSGIIVTEDDVNNQLEMLARQTGVEIEEFDTILLNVYGLGKNEFISQVVRPSLYESKLQLMVSSDRQLNLDAFSKAEDLLGKLKSGESFSSLAKEFSDDLSNSEIGGDLGWAPQGFFVKEFNDAIFSMEQGEVSGIVSTQFGLHIIELLEQTKDEEGTVLAHSRHILVNTRDFYDWLDGEKEKVSVWKFPVQ